MKPGEFGECEIINCLGDDKYNYLFLRDPEKDIYYILINGVYFAQFDEYKNALIVHDMMSLHFKEYLHIYEQEE